MALKRVIKKLEDVEESLRGFYKQSGEDFVLQVDGADVEDVTALKSAKEHEKNLRVATERERDEARDRVATLTTERDSAITERDNAIAAKGQDVNALEASWQQKLADAEAKGAAAVAELTSEVERLLVTNTAVSMAATISTVPELVQDVIAKRLKVEKGADGRYFTRVLDEQGQPSAKTVDELQQELLANKKYSAIIISGKGSGGGAGETPPGGGADGKKWLDYSDAELVQLRKDDPEAYDRLKAAHYAAA